MPRITPRNRTLAAIWLALACSAGAGVISDARVERLLAEAKQAEGEERWGDASLALRAVLEEDPDHAVAAPALLALHEGGRVDVSVDEGEVASVAKILGDGFYRVETPWFVVLSDCDEVWTAARAGVLERTARQYRKAMEKLGLAWTPPSSKLVCVLFAEHGDFVAFAGEHDGVRANWVSGYYATGSNRVAFFDERTSPSVRRAQERLDEADARSGTDARRALAQARDDLDAHAREASIAKTVHEAVHQLAFNCNLQRRSRSYPFWFTEGLASSFETGEPRHAFGPSIEQPETDEAVRAAWERGALLPLVELVAVTDASGLSTEAASVIYAQSNSLFRYLYRFEREEVAAYARALWSSEGGNHDGVAHEKLFREHFGDPSSLERKWLKRAVE